MFVPLGIQHAIRMRHIVICGLPRSTIFIHIISYKVRFSEKKVNEHKMCVVISSTNMSQTFLILKSVERDMIKKAQWSSCKVPFVRVRL